MLGQVLGSIPIIGPLLGGLFGGGQPQQAGAAGAGAGGGADPLAALAPILGMIGQQHPGGLGPLGTALQGALGGGGAGGGASLAPLLAAITGGGAGGGSGGLAGQVGASTAGSFLATQLARAAERPDPQAQAGLQELGRRAAQDPIINAQDRAGRETVQRVKEALGPELDGIRQLARERSLQVQATSEHRDLIARDEFRREVLTRLRALEAGQARAGVGRRY
jgi:hypothetical protein